MKIYVSDLGNVFEVVSENTREAKLLHIGRRFSRADLDSCEPVIDGITARLSHSTIDEYLKNGVFRRAVRLIGGNLVDEEDYLLAR